ncbi:MAG: hypothetical protein U0T81_19220 [Saprospiraceae bacterium]
MKNICLQRLIVVTLTITLSITAIIAQKLPSLVVAGVESKNVDLSNSTLNDILNLQIKKINLFDVINHYDALQVSTQNQIQVDKCFDKKCMYELGTVLGADKVLTAQLEKYNDKIYISIRQLDVASKEIEKNYSLEFLSLEKEIPVMIEVTVKKMNNLPIDEHHFSQITTIQTLENKSVNSEINRLNLSGPRFGFTFIGGPDARSYKRPESPGGFDAAPLISNIGYQFEVAYLNQGDIQGLFEFVPTISGIEHGTLIPSISLLHGVRSNKTGLEFSVGPLFVLTKRALGYYGDNGEWIRTGDNTSSLPKDIQEKVSNELDRAGRLHLDGGLLMAVGKSFRSGSINFPVNLFTVIRQNSLRIGFSMGFNSKSSNH